MADPSFGLEKITTFRKRVVLVFQLILQVEMMPSALIPGNVDLQNSRNLFSVFSRLEYPKSDYLEIGMLSFCQINLSSMFTIVV